MTTFDKYEQSVMQTYGRFNVSFVKGQGCTLYDENGKSYIDFASGIGVNSIGYADDTWVKAVSEQAAKLAHVSNLYYTEPCGDLAVRLTELSGMKNVFFANSGAEANEGIIKLARKYSFDKYGKGRSTVVTLRNSFHGRTVTTLSATGQDVFHNYFFPFTEGFRYVDANDISALENEKDDVCAVLLEVVQGEGGVLLLDKEYVERVRKLCDKRDWLMLVDEVQTGIGRTGKWFGYQHYGVLPDAVSFAKGIAGGLPLGGVMANEKCAVVLGPKTHATTFGGNPVCCSAALATLDVIEKVLPDVSRKGKLIRDSLIGVKGVKGVRGLGLMIGIAVDKPHTEIAAGALANGLVCLTAGSDTVRLLPPLVISDEDILAGIEILKGLL